MTLLVGYHRSYAEYNSWANEQIIAAIAQLPDEEYYRPILPKSRSIHEILNHILVMDKVWLGEVNQVDLGITSGKQLLHESKDAYIRDRRATDAEIAGMLGRLSDADLIATISYDEPQDGFQEWPMSMEIAHVFRHQVHHRGQLSILLQHSSVAEQPKLDGFFLPSALRNGSPDAAEAAVQAAPMPVDPQVEART
jgi:uncharacterized damage-inducible protein DinB